jgi:hypothetical protein
MNMDIQTATRLCSQKWQVARIMTLVFLVVACGFLASSLLVESPMASTETAVPTWRIR